MKRLAVVMLIALFASVANAEEIELKTSEGSLYGTLEIPKSTSSPPIVLIISGSGPTDRDGNIQGIEGKNNSLKYLAEALPRKGIATLRFDKRGVGKSFSSSLSEKDLRFETYIDDVASWVNYLKDHGAYSKYFILGHSEGSLIGMVAAQRGNVDGFISVSGAGRPAPDIIVAQMRKQLSADLLKEAERTIANLKAGITVELPSPALNALFRESVQPYLISWFKYDPAREIGRLNIPIFIIQGTTDIQVSVDDARILYDAGKGARLVIIEGMNHVLKQVPDDGQKQLASYGDPSLPISEELVDEIESFMSMVGE